MNLIVINDLKEEIHVVMVDTFKTPDSMSPEDVSEAFWSGFNVCNKDWVHLCNLGKESGLLEGHQKAKRMLEY